jgi:hypothetical protein
VCADAEPGVAPFKLRCRSGGSRGAASDLVFQPIFSSLQHVLCAMKALTPRRVAESIERVETTIRATTKQPAVYVQSVVSIWAASFVPC